MSLLAQAYQTSKNILSDKDPLQGIIRAAQNAHLPDIGLSTIAMGTKNLFGNTALAAPNDNGGSSQSDNSNNNGVWQGPLKPPDPLTSTKTAGSVLSTAEKNQLASIGKGWDDSGSEIDSASKALSTSKNYINNIGKVRDQMQKSLDAYKAKEDAAVAGNKTLIENNQNRDLTAMAGQVKDKIDSTNVMLGAASNGSAGRQYARKISADAGMNRANLLTTYGDQTSQQNQDAQTAEKDYKIQMQHADEWEQTNYQQAMDDYNSQKEAIDRLKNKSSGWKDEDIKAASSKNLDTLMSTVNNIKNQARQFQLNLADKITAYGGLADALDTAAVPISAPAELNTPKFSDNIDLTDPNAGSDWMDPTAAPKPARVIKGYDALGNPIYDDGTIGTAADVAAAA